MALTKQQAKGCGHFVGKWSKEYPRLYGRRALRGEAHKRGNWRFDNAERGPIIKRQASRRVVIFCPHCGVRGWRLFRVLGKKIVMLDTGEQCKTVNCWSCNKNFTLSAACTAGCEHKMHCMFDGVVHPTFKVGWEEVEG